MSENNTTKNRKYKLAVGILGVSTVVLIGLVVAAWPAAPMNVLWWWGGVASMVLTMYGAANVVQKFNGKVPR